MIVVGITGASGAILGVRLVEELLGHNRKVAAIVSAQGRAVMAHELSFKPSAKRPLRKLLMQRGLKYPGENLQEFDDSNLFATVASGTSPFRAVVVMPASMKTLAAVANGYANTLITRACDVALKEKRPCILAPRETPLSLIHVENMRKVMLAGAHMAPPIPGFYTRPKTLDDVVNFAVGKVLNLLDVEHSLFESWSGETGET